VHAWQPIRWDRHPVDVRRQALRECAEPAALSRAALLPPWCVAAGCSRVTYYGRRAAAAAAPPAAAPPAAAAAPARRRLLRVPGALLD
jgi:hypothetical protein